jgi:curli biogenesis system outer membrane secretion channel CsgG
MVKLTTVSLALLLPVLITVPVRAIRQTTKVVRAQPVGQAGIARVTKNMYCSDQELAIAQALLTLCSL